MKVDLKNDEVPLAVADTAGILARNCGVKTKTIYQSMSRAKKHGWRCCWVKLEVEDDENNT